MNHLITFLDIASAITIVVTLNLVQKYNKAWLVYAIGNFLFCALTWYKDLPALTIMGGILFFTGMRNYKRGKKEK